MITVESSVQIDKPVEDVFAYAVTPENGPKWQVGLDSIMDVSGGQEVGARYTEVRKFLGQEMKTIVETVEFEPNVKWVGKVVEGPVPYEVTVSYEAIGGGTKMTTHVEAEPKGFFKVAQGAVQGQLKKSLDEGGQNLKKLLEG
jgi:uncharacterized protein YndB with AHSA1/START domain